MINETYLITELYLCSAHFLKFWEKIFYIRLHKHATENNILNIEQLGFKENSSTEKAIYNLITY
jgi:hypothetical protein